jgi:hypothetical protein
VRIDYAKTLHWVRRAALGAAAFILATVIGGFILKLCEGASWYTRPWHTVAIVVTVLSTLLESTWFHWIGGLIIGFGLGIWLDDLLRRLAERSATLPVPAVRPPEFGFLDYQVDSHDAFKNMNQGLIDLGNRTEWVGGEINKRTATLSRIRSTLQDGSSKQAREMRRQADKTAKILDQYRRYIETPAKKLNGAVNRIVAAIEWSLRNRPEHLSESQIDGLHTVKGQVDVARGHLIGFVSVLRLTKGTSATLNVAIDNTVCVLERIMDDVERVGRVVDAVIISQAP